eukprot:11691816-Heterocapsa_arctica.AAC.1
MDSETMEPMEPVATVHDGQFDTLSDEYITLPPEQVYQRGNGMPDWWGAGANGETAAYDEDTLLFTARQLFEHEF